MRTYRIVFAPCRGMVFQIHATLPLLNSQRWVFAPCRGMVFQICFSLRRLITLIYIVFAPCRGMVFQIRSGGHCITYGNSEFSPPVGEWSFKLITMTLENIRKNCFRPLSGNGLSNPVFWNPLGAWLYFRICDGNCQNRRHPLIILSKRLVLRFVSIATQIS